MSQDKNKSGNYFHDEYEHLEIYQSALDILHATEGINCLVSEDKHYKDYCKKMVAAAKEILKHIHVAERGAFYDIKMEHATLIRREAKQIINLSIALDIDGYQEREYIQLLIQLINHFRLLFIDWVADFDNSYFEIDEWGLFNQPELDLYYDEDYELYEEDGDFNEDNYMDEEDIDYGEWIDPEDELDDEDIAF